LDTSHLRVSGLIQHSFLGGSACHSRNSSFQTFVKSPFSSRWREYNAWCPKQPGSHTGTHMLGQMRCERDLILSPDQMLQCMVILDYQTNEFIHTSSARMHFTFPSRKLCIHMRLRWCQRQAFNRLPSRKQPQPYHPRTDSHLIHQ
jgi:hypothetical protein